MKLSEVIARQTEKKTGGQVPGDRPRTPVNNRALKVIRTRETPNPNALQFVLNAQILETGNKSYSSPEDCGDDKLGQALFKNSAVKNVYIMKNFVTVTKQDTAGWNPLKTQVWNTIDELVEVYPSEEAGKTEHVDVSDFHGLPYEKKLEAIEMVLNRSIRSQLAQDGGGVDLQGLEGNEVLIHYQGACENCPSSMTGTLQHIEKLIKQQLHRELVVKSV
ncbi:NifU family protein [Nitrospina gracilis]|uniref:NifU family protein n=1 Tax=Nitrospina gracilis TaxID=35801 RepID=UPI001F178093|nr:NifU family protein [Nitrospina gracilis]MCF8720077.1 Fe-S cluster biogenesis protein NfuA [Nitrospina gracilis Nb-211]